MILTYKFIKFYLRYVGIIIKFNFNLSPRADEEV